MLEHDTLKPAGGKKIKRMRSNVSAKSDTSKIGYLLKVMHLSKDANINHETK